MGEVLSTLLENVIDGNLANEKENLLQFARRHLTFLEDTV